jgi:lipoprotein-releasing system ATP-binding protein
MVILKLVDIRRTYRQADRDLNVLVGASAELHSGQAVALVGPSGSGKSTLLHIAGLLERPTSGQVIVSGRDCATLEDNERTEMRRSTIGFIYQFHQLLAEFSARENVMIPQMIGGRGRVAAMARAEELLRLLGLGERLDHRPSQLSGGEQQRTAICRALANSPQVLLADEPTGNLDPATSEQVFRELIGLIERSGVAALIATHNLELARRMHRVVRIEAGKLVEVPRSSI